jgi:DNA processing protein
MQTIRTDQIIKALQLPRLGRKTAFKLFSLLTTNLNNDYELFDFIIENSDKYRLPKYTSIDWQKALNNFDEISHLNEKNGIKSISFYDKNFPELYKSINDTPIILNYIGDISNINNLPSVAIIGTREPTESGSKAAIRFGEIFGETHFNVVSGLAIGCDAGGHKGSLNKNGFTSAILAHGLDHIYPKENRKLAGEIINGGGLLLSEYNAGQKPLSNYFVERDRLQAGLSNGIIVVETDIIGGTMHTVRFASENNRRIAAYSHNKPELLCHPKTKGNQMLIKDKKAISLGTLDEISSYMNLLIQDHNNRLNLMENKKTFSENQEDNKDSSKQLNMFE